MPKTLANNKSLMLISSPFSLCCRSTLNSVYVYTGQDPEKPENIPNPQGRYTKLVHKTGTDMNWYMLHIVFPPNPWSYVSVVPVMPISTCFMMFALIWDFICLCVQNQQLS